MYHEFTLAARRVSDGRPLLLRSAGLAAVGEAIFLWVALIVFGVSRFRYSGAGHIDPGYNLVTRAASELGARGTPDALAFNAVYFYTTGALTILFAAGVYRATRTRLSGRVAAIVLVLSGLSEALAGVFTLDPYSQQATIVHLSVGLPFFLGVPVAALLIARALTGDLGSQRQSRFSLWMGVLLCVWVVAGIASMRFGLAPGIFQRVYGLLVTVWFVGLGLWLIRLSSRQAPRNE
jgi:hypothetical membrane protein